VFLMSSLSNANQQVYPTLFSCVVVYWTCALGSIGSSHVHFKSPSCVLEPSCWKVILCKEILLKSFVFSENVKSYIAVWPCRKWTYFRPHTQILSPTMLMLLIVGNWKVWFQDKQQCLTPIPNFIQNRPVIQALNHADEKMVGWTKG
jgi:hypothetical protein